MKLIRTIILTLFSVLAFADASAKTVSWAISPKYDKLSRHSSDIFLFQQNGKWGMVKPGNNEILPASYDFILPFVNGYALAGKFEGNRFLLESIVKEDGSVYNVSDILYLPLIDKTTPQYFSDGKLVVYNRNGKYGYINPSGQIIIKCQFDNALPFKEGWAPVKQGNYFKFIKDTYDRNPSQSVLRVDFHYGEMTLASCFSNGRAAIAYNKDYALIGPNGQKVRKLNETEFKQTSKNNNSAPNKNDGYSSVKNYIEFSENGLLGLKQGSDLIVKPQFTSFPSQYDDGYVVTEVNGRQGLLGVTEGNYSFDLKSESGSTSELEVERNGLIEGVNMNISLPSAHNNLKLVVDCGNGIKQDVTSQLTVNGTTATASVNPSPTANAENCIISAELANDGIIVAETSKDFTLSYPVILRVSKPEAVSSKADQDNKVTIYSNIYNDSNKAVTVEVTLSAKKTVSGTYTIKPHGSDRISLTEEIKVAQKVNASITLSTGEKASNSLYLEPYF